MIEKTVYGNKINYGVYETMEEAKEQVKVLNENNWIKSDVTGFNDDDSFSRYKLVTLANNRYMVINSSDNREYGIYNNKKYAEIIIRILPYYENRIDIEKVQKYATREFYKYITPEKSGRYRIRVSNINTSRCRNIKDALEERDILLKYKDLLDEDDMEELLCNLSLQEYGVYEDSLPVPPWENRHTNINRNDKGYYIIKTVNRKIVLGPFKTEFVCKQVLKFLNKHDWNRDSVQKIKNITLDVHKPDRNIIKYNGKYEIIHTHNKKREVYYTTDNLIKARFIRNMLERQSWDKSNIKSCEKAYEKNKDRMKIINI